MTSNPSDESADAPRRTPNAASIDPLAPARDIPKMSFGDWSASRPAVIDYGGRVATSTSAPPQATPVTDIAPATATTSQAQTESGARPSRVYHRDADPAVVGPAVANELLRALSDMANRDDTGARIYDFQQYLDDIIFYFGFSINEWVISTIIWAIWLYFLIVDLDFSQATDPNVLVAARGVLMPFSEYLNYLVRFAVCATLYRGALVFVYIPVLNLTEGRIPSVYVRKLIGSLTAIALFVIVAFIALLFGLDELLIG